MSGDRGGSGDPFAPGTTHAGWTVTSLLQAGARPRYVVEQGDRSAMLTAFPLEGPSGALHRALAERLARCQAVAHEALERVDAGVVEGAAFVVLPPLERLGEEALDAKAALEHGARLARALGALHARGVVHGEVDAWSIVKRPDGKLGLLPPGLRGPPPGLDTLGLGADPRFAAPEVLDGRPATPASDVFALGLVLARFVAGQVLVGAADPVDAIAARGRAPVPALAAVAKQRQLPAAVLALHEVLCAYAPEERPQDGEAAARTIEEAARGRAPQRPARSFARVQAVGIGGPLVLLALFGAAVGALVHLLSARYPLVDPLAGVGF